MFQTGGAGRDRTGDLLNANQALSQLSYSPKKKRSLEADWMPATRKAYAGRGNSLQNQSGERRDVRLVIADPQFRTFGTAHRSGVQRLPLTS